MTTTKLDYDLCMTTGRDAGNRNMKKHKRDCWNIDDWNIATETANRLFKISPDFAHTIP